KWSWHLIPLSPAGDKNAKQHPEKETKTDQPGLGKNIYIVIVRYPRIVRVIIFVKGKIPGRSCAKEQVGLGQRQIKNDDLPNIETVRVIVDRIVPNIVNIVVHPQRKNNQTAKQKNKEQFGRAHKRQKEQSDKRGHPAGKPCRAEFRAEIKIDSRETDEKGALPSFHGIVKECLPQRQCDDPQGIRGSRFQNKGAETKRENAQPL